MKTAIRRLLDGFDFVSSKRFFSQLGEDAVLQAHFRETCGEPSRLGSLLNFQRLRAGFYVDVGAFSPKRVSNTYWFYRKGWRGLTIEPNPLVVGDFRRARRRDTHLNMAVADFEGTAYYNTSGYAASNYISEAAVSAPGVQSMPIRVQPLRKILADHADGLTIDLLSIDCEGHDLRVLQSNDWTRYRPQVVLAEDYIDGLEGLQRSELVQYMADQGYDILFWTLASIAFRPRGPSD